MTELKLTPKQERFACKYVELSNATEAYKAAYNTENMNEKTINEAACRLVNNSKVSARIDQLKASIEKELIFTVQDAMKEYEEARSIAKVKDEPATMVKATTGKAKVAGLDVQKIDGKIEIEVIA